MRHAEPVQDFGDLPRNAFSCLGAGLMYLLGQGEIILFQPGHLFGQRFGIVLRRLPLFQFFVQVLGVSPQFSRGDLMLAGKVVNCSQTLLDFGQALGVEVHPVQCGAQQADRLLHAVHRLRQQFPGGIQLRVDLRRLL